ncbi:DUF6544 family protein [Mariniphaga sp.]|uniref:DUF6544 family protein n=1 Tax=Mariniphaga sp. TaxID=1954475 RepID=UPI00356864BE
MTSFKQKIKEETSVVLGNTTSRKSEILTEKEILHLPAPVQKWLKVSGAIGKEKIRTVALKQSFQMKLKPEQKNWKQAITQQFFNAENPAFIWTVRMKMAPFVSVLGRDKFIDGKGEMQMTLNGILNLGKETGEKMDEGTLQRYLGETVWFPSGMVSPHISWQELDPHSAKATMNFKETSGSGNFYFNSEGIFEKFVAMRYYGNAKDAKRYEWIITAQEHAEFNGIKIPSKLEATWMLDSGPWTWLKLEIAEVDYNPDPKNLNQLI